MEHLNPGWLTVGLSLLIIFAKIVERMQNDRSRPEESIQALRLEIGNKFHEVELQISGIPERVMDKAVARFATIERNQMLAAKVDDLIHRVEQLEKTA